MIVKIKYGQPKLVMKLNQCADSEDWYKKFILTIRPPSDLPCDFIRNSMWDISGCWLAYDGPRGTTPPSPPSLMYRAFEANCDGNIVFLLDGKLKHLHPGRYIGCINTSQGDFVGEFDIDIISTPYVIRELEVVDGESVCVK